MGDKLKIVEPEEAYELLARVVDEKGADYVDPTMCRYQRDGHPSCIVGHALVLAGASPSELVLLDMVGPHGRSVSAGSIPRHLDGVSDRAAEVFRAAQAAQDRGYRWGYALTHARILVENFRGADEAAASA